MPYAPPSFNITCNIWTSGFGPPLAPRIALQLCQLRSSLRQWSGEDSSHAFVPYWEVLLPAGTDVRDFSTVASADTIEAPAGTGRYYTVMYVDDVGKGFANEYRVAIVRKTGTWPTPIP